jgi:hypothetical protein
MIWARTRISFDGVEALLEFVVLQFVGLKDMRPTDTALRAQFVAVAETRPMRACGSARERIPRCPAAAVAVIAFSASSIAL